MNEKFIDNKGNYCIFLDQGIKYSINNTVAFVRYINISKFIINNGIGFEEINETTKKKSYHYFSFDTTQEEERLKAAINHANKISDGHKNSAPKVSNSGNKKTYTTQEKHRQGIIILLLAAAMIIIGCATGATVLVIPSIICVFVGLYMWSTNKSQYEIDQNKRLAEAQANLLIAKAKAGQKITDDDFVTTRSAKEKAQRKAETKEIVKGAVIGGVVAGDVGAVVGAIAAKNKIDNKKNNN